MNFYIANLAKIGDKFIVWITDDIYTVTSISKKATSLKSINANGDEKVFIWRNGCGNYVIKNTAISIRKWL